MALTDTDLSSAPAVRRTDSSSRTRRITGHAAHLPGNEALPQPGSVAGRFRCGARGEHWWWSPELFALHGIPSGAAQPSAELLLAGIHRDDRDRVREALDRALDAGVPFAVQHRVLRADGSEFTAVLFGEPEVVEEGTVAAVSGLVIDVTEGRSAGPDNQLHALEVEVDQLRTAMASRATIEQAKGALMLLMGCGDQVAFDLLAHISSHTHRKVRDVAGAIVASASGSTPLPDDVKDILHDACPPGQHVH